MPRRVARRSDANGKGCATKRCVVPYGDERVQDANGPAIYVAYSAVPCKARRRRRSAHWADRQLERENRTAALARLEAEQAVHRIRQLLGDRQSQPSRRFAGRRPRAQTY